MQSQKYDYNNIIMIQVSAFQEGTRGTYMPLLHNISNLLKKILDFTIHGALYLFKSIVVNLGTKII